MYLIEKYTKLIDNNLIEKNLIKPSFKLSSDMSIINVNKGVRLTDQRKVMPKFYQNKRSLWIDHQTLMNYKEFLH